LCLTRRADRIRISARVTGKGFPEFRRRAFRLVFLGSVIDRVDLLGSEMRILGGKAEFENRGQDFDLSFSVCG
jgi:alpha-glucosidase